MTNSFGFGGASSALGRDMVSIVVRAVCGQVGLEPTGARLIKFTNNAVLDLPHESVVVRIAGSRTVRDRVSKVIAVASWLAEHRMPAVQLFPGFSQPVEAYGHLATLWTRVPATGRAPTGADLGRILRRYHSLPSPETPLPPWRPLAPIRQRIAETDGLPQHDVAFLETKCEQLEEALAGLVYALPPGPIHGDSFLGNLIPGPEGAVICDFDSAAYGPREWDLTPVAVGELRFRYPGNPQEKLATTYGFDITGWPGFPVFRELRELQLVTSVLPVLHGNPSLADQWRHRLRTFRNGDLDAAWTPYR
ncbi:aminoglycoside phosphotransferase family protein [Micromonospora sp. NPDC049240]|uniref:aminoglycoside phosphotransferase family protein n=1 Tax=Micromonospora sp. NPDC049240 TaxID=3155151 RepID=UPI0033FAFD2E